MTDQPPPDQFISYVPSHNKPWVTETTRFLVNLILWVLLIGLLLIAAYFVGWWMMDVWHNSHSSY